MTSRVTAWLLLSLLLGMSGQAMGQATVPAQPAPPGTPETLPEVIEPPPGTTESPAQAPAGTEQLQQNDGVIQAPGGVDPGLVKPPPDAGAAKMPVIPPPAAPPSN